MQSLIKFGFTQQDVDCLTYIYNFGGKVTTNTLAQLGCNQAQCQRLMYANNLYLGKIVIDSIPKLAKHFRIVYGYNQEQATKMAYQYNLDNGGVDTKEGLIGHLKKINRGSYKITMDDLVASKINSVPRLAVVANIPQEPYSVWNSNQYKGIDALYKVVDATSSKITVETARKPLLNYGAPKTLPGILEIKGVKQNGNAIVTFDRNYCKLCNRFIIIASLRNPEFHLGKYEIICFEGTKVYVYAINMGIKENLNYNKGNQRIYDYGIFPKDIKNKLTVIAKSMYGFLKGMNVEYFEPNSDYTVVPVEQRLSCDDGLDMGD